MEASELFYELDGTSDRDGWADYPKDKVIVIFYGTTMERLEVTGAAHSEENGGEFHIYAQRELPKLVS